MTREEAIKKLRQMTLPEETMEILEALAPELKESKDERIIRMIENTLRDAVICERISELSYVEMSAYLKKQKEQKPATIVRIPKFRVGDIIQHVPLEKWDTVRRITSVDEHGYNISLLGDRVGGGFIGFSFEDEYELIEQKPAEWSERDKKMMNEIITIMDGGKVTSGTYLSEYVAWLKSLPERFNLQLIQEWSEEDEKMLCEITQNVNAYDAYTGTIFQQLEHHDKKMNWLKSLRPSWRPSKEQMEALDCVAGAFSPNNKEYKMVMHHINTLRNMLKQL